MGYGTGQVLAVEADMTGDLRVLVVDDDRIIRQTTLRQLVNAGFDATSAGDAAEALALLETQPVDVVVSDLRMPGMDGLAFLRKARERAPGIDAILVTAFGSIASAVTAMREGAYDYLTKPFPFEELEIRLHRIAKVRAATRELTELRALLDVSPADGLVGRSEVMRVVRERIAIYANHPSPVLVTGETGTGKELVARALHRLGSRSKAAFVAIGSGAVPGELAESVFFGHERGAFTGAIKDRKGAFEQANGGTLLLDDVDDLPLSLQVKLLRVLQEGVINRVGSDRPVPVDVRIVATTKVDLQQLVGVGKFRTDLYYRLRGLEISLPSLRHRDGDVVLLANHFLRLMAKAGGRPQAQLSDAVQARLRRYRWPGNVRELRRTMEACDALSLGGLIQPEHLPSVFQRVTGAGQLFSLNLDQVDAVVMAELVRTFEDELVTWAMAHAGGRQTVAADRLGIPRTTLQSKLRRISTKE